MTENNKTIFDDKDFPPDMTSIIGTSLIDE
jgi:hypothetical protein